MQENAQELFSERKEEQIDLKAHQIFRYINPGSYMQVRKQIQLNKSKEVESADKIVPKIPVDLIVEASERNYNDEDSVLDARTKLDSFLRSTVRAKPGNSPYIPF